MQKVKDYNDLAITLVGIANIAATEWLDNATPKFRVVDAKNGQTQGFMLGNCGFSYIFGLKRNSKHAKEFAKRGMMTYGGKNLKVRHSLSMRQEKDLQDSANRAVVKYLKENFEGFDALWVDSRDD